MARFVWGASLVTLAGCANFSSDGGFGKVEQLTLEGTGQTPRLLRSDADRALVQGRVRELLAQPLTPDGAVELAFLNNRGLQARFAALGVAEADLVAAGRLRGPTLSLGRLAGGGIVEIDRAIVFDVLSLLAMPRLQRQEQARFEQAQLQAASDAVALAGDARRAWFRAVAAQEVLRYQGQVKDAADAANELARRMAAAGNFSALQQMREQAFHADATVQLARAEHAVVAERSALARVTGLEADAALLLPERLPDLPAQPLAADQAEQGALQKRLDIRLAQREWQALSAGIGPAARWTDGVQLGLQNKSQTGEPTRNGAVLELSLPSLATSPVAVRAEAVRAQAEHRLADVTLKARSEVRVAWSAYRTAYDLARYERDERVPLRQRIAQENQLRYNGMLVSTFELLADAREQVASVVGAIEALREHWLAHTDLQAAWAGAKV